VRQFIKCLETLCETDATVVLSGDFNMPYLDWSCPVFISDNDRCSTLFNEFASFFALKQFVDVNTRLKTSSTSSFNSSGSILDLLLCNDVFALHNVSVNTPFSTSDHCTIDFNILCHVKLFKHNFEYRNFNVADWNNINTFLNNINWDDAFAECSSPEECYNEFNTIISHCIDCFVPLCVVKTSLTNKSRFGVPYPLHVKKLLRQKLSIWKRFKAYRTESLRLQYRDISSRCRYAIYKSVQHYEESIIDSNNLGRFSDTPIQNLLINQMLALCSSLMARSPLIQ